MQIVRWPWLSRVSRLLATPKPEPAHQARRILAMQRNIVLPVKAMVTGVVLYYLFYSHWLDVVATTQGVILETLQNFLVFYVLFNAAIASMMLVIRRFPLGLVQWAVFTVGLVDGLFLAGLTLVTGGFESILFWVFPGVIVLNALSIPLATPQIVLNLSLSIFYLGAGVLDAQIGDTESSVPSWPAPQEYPARSKKGFPWKSRMRFSPLTGANIRDLPALANRLKQQTDGVSQFLWGQFSPATRQKVSEYSGVGSASKLLQEALVAELNLITLGPSIYDNRRFAGVTLSEETQRLIAENPPGEAAARLNQLCLEDAFSLELVKRSDPKILVYESPPETPEPFLLKVIILWMMTLWCYGVQVLAARQRRAEEEAQEFAARQDQLHAAGRLAAEIAHQIKNPLGIINNAAYALQRSLEHDRNSAADQLQIIREEVERSDKIITELMGYAQLAEGKVEKLQVPEELDRAIAKVFPPGARYQVEIRRDVAADLPALLMQRNHFSEVMVNILQNAREAMNGSGRLEVTAWTGEDEDVLISIKDHGPGIAPEKIGKIFEPYFTTKAKGTGLGLAIVKHNVETYEGTIRVESELGQGTEFIVRFPTRTFMKIRK